ncbi:MAG TPA: sulfate permease [Pseudomonadales bacterium]|nr:sulfate permease [Pseudomonadales bacterium]
MRYLPLLEWIKTYNRAHLAADLLAALIVTLMLIPQSFAYALLAGLPPETGLYATVLPLLAYMVFGTSRTLSVGPVAVASLMTAAAVHEVVPEGGAAASEAAIALALLSGAMLLVLGLLRFGLIANLLSHPVVAGFITASGILIALSQLGALLGITAGGNNLLVLLSALFGNFSHIQPETALIGISSVLLLIFIRKKLSSLLVKVGLSPHAAAMLSKIGPIVVVVLATFVVWFLQWDQHGVALIGHIPQGLPTLHWPQSHWFFSPELIQAAFLIGLIGYVESVSVGKTLGAKRRQRIDPDQELIGLGAANLASGLSGGFPVTGGFARSVVNFDAGAQTPAASGFAAVGVAVMALAFSSWLSFLPKAVLAATIIVAVSALVDFSILKKSWHYAKTDFIAVLGTIVVTLLQGVELGVLSGVLASIALHIFKTSRPHIAEVGLIEGTEHFRNIKRYRVLTHPSIVSLRVDESLYFANATFLENKIYSLVATRKDLKHVVLMCSAINEIDMSALEALEAINERLHEQGICFHLSEVKGPVMDALKRSDFLTHLNGQIFLTQFQAIETIKNK